MKISEYIKELEHLIELDGDLETERLIMTDESCNLILDGKMMKFNEYREDKLC